MWSYLVECLCTIGFIFGVFVIPAGAYLVVRKIIFGLLILNKDEEVDEMNEKYKKYERMFSYMMDYNP